MTARTPQDHKKAKAELGDFTWTVGDEKVTLPALDSLMTFGTVRKTRHLPQSDALFLVLEENVDEPTLTVLDKMRASEIEAFLVAWQEHSGMDMGESSASSNS